MSFGNFKLMYTSGTATFSVVALVIAMVVCFISWARSGYAKSYFLLESLRFILVLLAIVTLNGPEWVDEDKPDQRPLVAVVYDSSGSMKTKDVIDPENVSAPPKTREEVVKPLLENEVWKSVSERMDVVFEEFSSDLKNPAEATDIDTALDRTLEKHKGSLRAVVLISDGDWNIGKSPSAAATKLRTRGIPVYPLGVGAETRLPDIELVSLDAPTSGVPNKSMRIPFVITSAMTRDYETTLEFSASDGQTQRKAVKVPAMGRLRDTIEWRPKVTIDRGDEEAKVRVDLTLKVPEAPGELLPDNNELTVPITISQEAIKVLIVESFPRWEYRYIRNALERDPGIEVNCLMFHPTLKGVGGGRGYLKEFPTDKQLSEYDVVFLGDVGIDVKQLSVDQCESLRQLVRAQASGLVFLPGFRGYQNSMLLADQDADQRKELADLYPVAMDPGQPKGWGSTRPAQFDLTEAGRQSLLTRLSSDNDENVRIWNTLPGFQWYAAAVQARPGATVLATHRTETSRSGRVPLIVTRTSGLGKVLYMGSDGAWRWREGVEDLYHYRFWGQVVRWMAYQRNISESKSMRLFPTPERPSVEDVVTLNVNAQSPDGEPMQSGTISVAIQSPAGELKNVRLSPAGEDMWGLFNGTFEPKESGTYFLTTRCAETGDELRTELVVQGLAREKIGQPARTDVLDEIARISRGKLTSIHEVNTVVTEVAKLPEPEPQVKRTRIWAEWGWGSLIIVLLSIFWIGRKLIGVI